MEGVMAVWVGGVGVRRNELKAGGGEGVGGVEEIWEGVIFLFLWFPLKA
jgi:hypothetical protein